MKIRTNHLLVAVSFVASTAIVGFGGSVLVNADSTSSAPTRNTVARYTIKQDRLTAEAEVLGMSSTKLQDQLKSQTMKRVIAAAGLTKTTFKQKVQGQLRTDLQNQGYSQTQIDRALSHKVKQ